MLSVKVASWHDHPGIAASRRHTGGAPEAQSPHAARVAPRNEGAFGPGLRRGDETENKSRYFLSTNALQNLNNAAGLLSAPHRQIPPGVRNSVVSRRTRRAKVTIR